MKLKKAKHYKSHLMGKLNELFSKPNTRVAVTHLS